MFEFFSATKTCPNYYHHLFITYHHITYMTGYRQIEITLVERRKNNNGLQSNLA